MNVTLFDKEAHISSSDVYFAYMILKSFDDNKVKKMSFFKLAKKIKNMDAATSEKQLLYGMMFLYALGILEMNGHEVTVARI